MAPPISLTTAQARLSTYLDAEAAVLRNQSYSIGDRSLTRANLKEIREGIDYWSAKVNELQRNASGGIQVQLGVPT